MKKIIYSIRRKVFMFSMVVATSIVLSAYGPSDMGAWDAAYELSNRVVTEDMTEREIAAACSRAINAHYQYDYDAFNDWRAVEAGKSAENLVKTGKGICAGMSKLLQIMLDQRGIKCDLWVGESASGNHMWCVVTFKDGTQAAYDPTTIYADGLSQEEYEAKCLIRNSKKLNKHQ